MRTIVRMARALAAACLVALTGCSEIFGSDYDYARVGVTVTDTQGRGVRGVVLTLYTGLRQHAYASTGPDGQHEFRFVVAGNYGVYATPPPGYHFRPGDLPYTIMDIEPGDVREVEFVLVRSSDGVE